MAKDKIIAATNGRIPLIGTFFLTKEAADNYVREKRRQFINGFRVIHIKNGFMVIGDKQIKGWADMIIK